MMDEGKDRQDATGVVTYQSCAAAGMSASETAAAMGVKVGAVYGAARRFGLVFRDTRRERMKALNADPEFAERSRERMKALNADPEFAERHRERMKALHADPEFAERNRERSRERMKALHADPEFNPLAALLPVERADYDVLVKKGGLSRGAALTAVGRGDLVRA